MAVTGIVLAAVYVLWMYQRIFTGPTPPTGTRTRDLNRREVGVIAPLMVGLVLFGFYPMPLLDVSNPTVDTLLQHVGVSDDEPVVRGASAWALGQIASDDACACLRRRAVVEADAEVSGEIEAALAVALT